MACKCKNCDKVMHALNGTMVILKDDLWLSIAEKKDILCDACIESELGRKIVAEDFKEPDSSYQIQFGLTHILCNSSYAYKNNIKL